MARKWFIVGLLLLIVLAGSAQAVSVNITVKDPTGASAKGDYKIFDTNGSTAKSGTIDGSIAVDLSVGNYYLFVITKNETIVYALTVTGSTSNVTVDASTMKYAKVLAEFPKIYIGTPTALVTFKIANTNVSYGFATNWTLYASNLASSLTYPNETKTGIYKFVFEKLVVDGTESNETSVNLDFTADKTIKAVYKSEYVIEPMYLMLLIGIVAFGLIAIVVVSGKKAKSAIIENEVNSMKFYKRRL